MTIQKRCRDSCQMNSIFILAGTNNETGIQNNPDTTSDVIADTSIDAVEDVSEEKEEISSK